MAEFAEAIGIACSAAFPHESTLSECAHLDVVVCVSQAVRPGQRAAELVHDSHLLIVSHADPQLLQPPARRERACSACQLDCPASRPPTCLVATHAQAKAPQRILCCMQLALRMRGMLCLAIAGPNVQSTGHSTHLCKHRPVVPYDRPPRPHPIVNSLLLIQPFQAERMVTQLGSPASQGRNA